MKERIEKRLIELEQAKQQFYANINACEGAIMELKKLLVEETNDNQKNDNQKN